MKIVCKNSRIHNFFRLSLTFGPFFELKKVGLIDFGEVVVGGEEVVEVEEFLTCIVQANARGFDIKIQLRLYR